MSKRRVTSTQCGHCQLILCKSITKYTCKKCFGSYCCAGHYICIDETIFKYCMNLGSYALYWPYGMYLKYLLAIRGWMITISISNIYLCLNGCKIEFWECMSTITKATTPKYCMNLGSYALYWPYGKRLEQLLAIRGLIITIASSNIYICLNGYKIELWIMSSH